MRLPEWQLPQNLSGANQSDPIAAIDLERDVVKERPAGERF